MAINPAQLGLGPSPFMANPGYTGPNGTGEYNPEYFPTQETAQAIAAQYGGNVVTGNTLTGAPGSPFSLNQPQYLIQLPNGMTINPGTIAAIQQSANGAPLTPQQNALIQDVLNGSDGKALNVPGLNGTGNGAQKAAPQQQAAATSNYGNVPMVMSRRPDGTMQQIPVEQAVSESRGASATLPGSSTAETPNYPGVSDSPTPASSGDPTGGGLTRGILPGGYGVGQPDPMPNGAGAIGGTPTQFMYKNSNNVGDILQNDRNYAYGQGGELIGNYGQGMAAYQQRARSLDAVGDSAYADLLQNPGYTASQNDAINNNAGLDALGWTDAMGQGNQFTDAERAASMGNPNAGRDTYNAQADNLRQDARNYGANVAGQYDSGATALNTATGNMAGKLDASIDPSQLGLSQEYQDKYNFGPQQQLDLENDAARTVGQGTAAVTDQLQRQANAAGTNAPLAMSAALDRQRQTGAVASADAMTKARIQAAQLGLQTEQQKEATRLQTAQDIASRRASAATTAGQADIANQQFLTAGRANAATTTGQAYLDQSNRIAEQQTGLATAADATSAQRAQALAMNRQTVNQSNQAAQFSRGSYQDQAKSQRATQSAGATRADQTAARQDIRNQSQTDLNQSNSYMAGQLQAFSGVTGAGQASQSSAIKAAQLPTTLDKVVGAASGAASGLGLKQGGVVDKPTVATIGEDGPEIVIKLGGMNYKRRNEGAPAYA